MKLGDKIIEDEFIPDDRKILETDTIPETAMKIFTSFVVNQSCTITGFANFDGTVILRGEAVCMEIKRLDIVQNFTANGKGKSLRRKIRHKESVNLVGDRICDKAFRWAATGLESQKPTVTIWRVQ